MKRMTWAVTALLLVAGGLWTPLEASDHPLLDRFSFTLGSFFTTVDTDLRLDGRELGTGDRINLEDVLGLDASNTLVRFGGEFRIKRRHQVNFGYYELDRGSTRLLEREIHFGDETFPINVEVATFFNTRVVELSYTYWLLMKDKVVFGISAGGVNFFTFETGIALAGESVTIAEDASTDLPVPLVGLEVRHALAPKWMLRAHGSLISISNVEDYSGDLVNLGIALEYRLHKHFGLGASYDSVKLDVDREKRAFTGTVDYRISGAQLFVRIGF